MKRIIFLAGWIVISVAVLPAPGSAEEIPAEITATNRVAETNSQEVLRSYLQLQEQLHETQLAIERTRTESKDNAAETSELLKVRLETIEKALAAQRARELETMQSSNRMLLIISGSFASIGFIAMLLMAYFQWRTVSRLAELSAALPPAQLMLPSPRPLPALTSGENPVVVPNSVEQSNQKLLNSLERLEKRLLDLAHATQPISNGNGKEYAPSLHQSEAPMTSTASTTSEAIAGSGVSERLMSLLHEGQTLLNADRAQEALAAFDEAIALDPNNAETLVKRGTALEKLRKYPEAIQCYDRAIQADSSMTIAHLYKGGLLNRLERFGEALECYEEALRTQEGRAAAKV
jgi:tetratricopeptide (TPR) repeat protein